MWQCVHTSIHCRSSRLAVIQCKHPRSIAGTWFRPNRLHSVHRHSRPSRWGFPSNPRPPLPSRRAAPVQGCCSTYRLTCSLHCIISRASALAPGVSRQSAIRGMHTYSICSRTSSSLLLPRLVCVPRSGRSGRGLVLLLRLLETTHRGWSARGSAAGGSYLPLDLQLQLLDLRLPRGWRRRRRDRWRSRAGERPLGIPARDGGLGRARDARRAFPGA